MKRGLAAAAAVLAFAVLAYTAAWFYGAKRFEQTIAQWEDEVKARGASVAHDEINIVGFPLELAAVLHGLVIEFEATGVTFEPASVRLTTMLWNPNHIRYDFSGNHVFTFTSGTQTARETFDIETGEGEILFDGGRREDRLVASNVRSVSDDGIVKIARIEATGFTDPKPASASAASFEGAYTVSEIEFTDPLGVKLFEPPIEKLRLELAATGPFIEIFKDGTVADWAGSGGTLTLRDLAIEWNGFAFTASGDLGLDAELRPAGRVTLVSASFGDNLQSIEEKGLIRPEVALWIHHMTEPFVVPSGDGSRSDLVVPITAADGILSVGGQPIRAMPPFVLKPVSPR